MKALMITLGHNSSGLFYNGKDKPVGFEQERLDGIKSSSVFPIDALKKIEEIVGDRLVGSTILVSHWFDSFDTKNWPDKYWDQDYIGYLMDRYEMHFSKLESHFTHHDAHAYSSQAFLRHHIAGHQFEDDEKIHFIVADGFGNRQEVLSIYETTAKRLKHAKPLKQTHRVYGYGRSLGLLYQYATSFCGMKENQDEYKFLGYESHIDEVCSTKDILSLKESASKTASQWIDRFDKEEEIEIDLSYINIKALTHTKYVIHEHLSEIIMPLDIDADPYQIRVAVGFYIQRVVEEIMTNLVTMLGIKHVALSGGCFYNVKLNNAIMHEIPGKICIIPVAGDQGAAIGMHEYIHGNKATFDFSDLCFGTRSLDYTELSKERLDSDQHIILSHSDEHFVDVVAHLLNQDKIVNVVRGEMEFGPRALCNTSTLAKPNRVNVNYINMLNNRNTVMPMAPVMTIDKANAFFDHYFRHINDRVIGSNQYMILTHDYSPSIGIASSERYSGIVHKYPLEYRHSGRPQVIVNDDKRPIKEILKKVRYDALINTSYNTHGNPIVYSIQDAVAEFNTQRKLDEDNRAYLVIRCS